MPRNMLFVSLTLSTSCARLPKIKILSSPTCSRYYLPYLSPPPATSRRISAVAPSRVANSKHPFMANFMLLVPAADVRGGSDSYEANDNRLPLSRQLRGAEQSQTLNHTYTPFLQSLGQHRVVGVIENVSRDVPRLVPRQVFLVQQNAEELDDA
eukprot:64852-Hanusia_phi.AAC.2